MKHPFLPRLVSVLLMLCLIPAALAASDPPEALLKPDQIRMYQDSTYIDGSIIVGRGRQTYLYFTAPEDGFTSVTLNLRNDHGRAWGEAAPGADREYDLLYLRIMKACNLFYKYNLGYEIPWYPLYTNEGSFAQDGKQELYAAINPQYDSIGNTGDVAGIAYIYYRHYRGRDDLDTDPDTMYLSMARANAYPEGNAQDWIGWVDLLYTPADAAPFDQKAQAHAIVIRGEDCTHHCEQTTAAFGDLVTIRVTTADGYTLTGGTVTVNGIPLDLARQIAFSGSDTQVTLVFGMPQEDTTVLIAPAHG